MFFSSRVALGETLAGRVDYLRGTEPIVVCLREESLITSVALAARLRGWIYPLITEQITIPGDPRIIGVINQDGTLCYNSGLSHYEIEELEMEYHGIIQDAARQAFSKINARTRDYGELNKGALSGRTVILCDDIVRDELGISAINEFLKSVRVQKIISLVGNIDANISATFFRQSDDSVFLDVMTNMFDDSHYFQEPDQYSVEEKRQLAMNISQYWT